MNNFLYQILEKLTDSIFNLNKHKVPDGGLSGEVLTKTLDGVNWKSLPVTEEELNQINTKFNNIEVKINNLSSSSYTLPTASTNTLGGIKVGDNLSINNGVLSVDNTLTSKINAVDAAISMAGSAQTTASQANITANNISSNLTTHTDNSSIHVPSSGTTGYVLTKTPTGSEWKEVQTSSVAEVKPVTKWKVSPDSTSNTEYFALRSTVQQANNDIVIDWGDGSTTVLKEASVIEYSIALESDSDVYNHSSELPDNPDLNPTVYTGEWESDGELAFGFYHKYTTAGTYTVTITGSDYFGISHSFNYTYRRNKLTIEGGGIMSECLTDELPLAQNVTNLSYFAFMSAKLASIQIPTGMNLDRIDNWFGAFSTCTNLTSATGFKYKLFNAKQIGNLFEQCQKMTTCDLVLPPVIKYKNALNCVFLNCYVLTGDISKFFAKAGFLCAGKAEMTNTFFSCQNLTGTIPAEYLWNNPNVEWDYPMESGTSNKCFAYCSDELMAQAPVSWGGTASNDTINEIDPKIKKYIDSQVAILKSTLTKN